MLLPIVIVEASSVAMAVTVLWWLFKALLIGLLGVAVGIVVGNILCRWLF